MVGTLVVQWLRICLPKGRAHRLHLVREDLTC